MLQNEKKKREYSRFMDERIIDKQVRVQILGTLPPDRMHQDQTRGHARGIGRLN